ncbi:MAG: glycosyltransferase involved in cell wall biosynthesis [Verrucomicrobiales bacterium]|jgi:glycosyltransferase involved in cell wall biosynthesis
MAQKSLKLVYVGNRLERHGFSPTGIDKLSVLLSDDYEVVTASHARQPLVRLFDMIRVVMRNQDASYVLIDTYSTNAFYYAWVIGWVSYLLRIPYIPILHGGNLAARLDKSPLLCRQFFGRSHRNVAPSKFLEKIFVDRDFPVEVIPNALQVEDYVFHRRYRVRPRLLYVRSFDRTYNPGLAVRVLALLVAEHESATLCMVGPDKDGTRAEVEALANELGVIERIRFTGKIAPVLWRELSADYDIFINTTNVDNTPLSVIEAMALGLPVVSTSAGGLPYLVSEGKDGFLVDCDAADQFVDRIDRLVKNPELVAELTWNGRNTAEQFSSKNVVKAWRQLLEGELHSPRG